MVPPAWIDYTNHRGVRQWREIVPERVWHGTTEQHPNACWLLRAQAIDRGGAERDFALANIHEWRDWPPEGWRG